MIRAARSGCEPAAAALARKLVRKSYPRQRVISENRRGTAASRARLDFLLGA